MSKFTRSYYDWQGFLDSIPSSWVELYPSGSVDDKGRPKYSYKSGHSIISMIVNDYLLPKQDVVHTDTIAKYGTCYHTPLPTVSGLSASLQLKTPFSNAPFEEKCRDGKIVVSDYDVVNMSCLMHLGEQVISSKPYGSWTVARTSGAHNYAFSAYGPARFSEIWTAARCHDIARLHVGPTVQVIRPDQPPSTVTLTMGFPNGMYVRANQTLSVPRIQEVGTYVSASNLGLDPDAMLLDLYNALDTEFKDLIIMETSALANEGDLDFLTAVAELPETIKMIVDGYRFMAKVAQDVKKKEFSIHSRREAMILAKAKEAYAEYKGKADFATFYRKRRKYLAALVAKDITSDVANVYLQGRYAIAPTIYMLEDIGEVLLNMNLEFKRFRRRLVEEFDPVALLPEVPGFTCTFDGVARYTHRCMIKRAYSLESITEKLSRALMADVAVTLFEKTTYWISIIGNWFITFETALKSIKWRTIESEEGATYSVKTEVDGTLTYTGNINGQVTTFKVDLSVKNYTRKVINPQSHLGLYWNPDLGIWQYLDATAFAWNLVKRHVKPIHPDLKRNLPNGRPKPPIR